MHVHVLGICGSFMGGLARLAAARGDRVTGADSGVYPPMSEQLEAAGIELVEGWDPAQLTPAPDLIVVGNALSRGNPAVEAVLERDLPYTSGPAWLREYLLRDRHVVAVAGTHGKTTTASMIAHILAVTGFEPGFLIGGVPSGFGVSARLGEGLPFVVEADEYDSAFFDKRSKFVHYGPRTLVLNNLEFDHADIFEDLAAIQRQFHHLIRTVPGNGRILIHADDTALEAVLDRGCWTPVERFAPDADAGGADWCTTGVTDDGSRFDVSGPHGVGGRVEWSLLGRHNVANGLAAVAGARHAGADAGAACAALSAFSGVRRRLEVCGTPNGITVYDDFAHHPTAIATTLSGLRARVGGARILAALDLASNSMRMGIHRAGLAAALGAADRVYLLASRPLDWDPRTLTEDNRGRVTMFESPAALGACIGAEAAPGDHVVLMSNSGFGGLPAALPEQLAGQSAHGIDGG